MLAKNPLPGLRALALANVLTVLKLSTLYSMCAQCVYCSAKKLIPTVIHLNRYCNMSGRENSNFALCLESPERFLNQATFTLLKESAIKMMVPF